MSQFIFVRNKAQAASLAFPGKGQGPLGGTKAMQGGERLLSQAAAREGHGANSSASLGAGL